MKKQAKCRLSGRKVTYLGPLGPGYHGFHVFFARSHLTAEGSRALSVTRVGRIDSKCCQRVGVKL